MAEEDVKRFIAGLEELGGVTPVIKAEVEKEALKAAEEKRPYVYVWHLHRKVCKCTCQVAEIYVWNPQEAPYFNGWVKYLIGNGIVIDPVADMKRPKIPGAFQARDARFPEVMRKVSSLPPGCSQTIQITFHVPENVEQGSYFGSVFLIKQAWPCPELVEVNYSDFEVVAPVDP
jgi:hypothetical protein